MASAQSSKIPYPWTCDVWLVEDPSLLNNLFLYAKKKKNTTPDTIVSRTVGSMCIQRLQRQLCPESIALFIFLLLLALYWLSMSYLHLFGIRSGWAQLQGKDEHFWHFVHLLNYFVGVVWPFFSDAFV